MRQYWILIKTAENVVLQDSLILRALIRTHSWILKIKTPFGQWVVWLGNGQLTAWRNAKQHLDRVCFKVTRGICRGDAKSKPVLQATSLSLSTLCPHCAAWSWTCLEPHWVVWSFMEQRKELMGISEIFLIACLLLAPSSEVSERLCLESSL